MCVNLIQHTYLLNQSVVTNKRDAVDHPGVSLPGPQPMSTPEMKSKNHNYSELRRARAVRVVRGSNTDVNCICVLPVLACDFNGRLYT